MGAESPQEGTIMKRLPISLATAHTGPAISQAKQLAIYFGAGIVLPAALWALLRGISLVDQTAPETLAQLAICNLACWYVLGRLRKYARARLLSYVFPVNFAFFGVVFAVNNLFRASISHTLFATCFIATLAVSYLVTARIRHANPKLKHYVVGGGRIGVLAGQPGFEVIKSAQKLEHAINEDAVSGSIVADLHHDHPAEWERLFARAALRGIPVYHYRLLEEALTGEVRIDHLRENDLGSLIPNLPYMSAKRVSDIALVLLLSPFILPLLVIIAIAVKLDSEGSILFVQERAGFRGDSFRMVKFRTMHAAPSQLAQEDKRELAMTQDNDARITRIGRFLRKSRLDELPQAWNVLIGDMSWIGPRPEACELADWYESEIPFYSYRHIVRPGITGWAQVNQGHVTDLDSIQSKLRLDFYYVKNLSLWLDALIALKTLRVILGGIGAK